jgi:dienelactone hydrolase
MIPGYLRLLPAVALCICSTLPVTMAQAAERCAATLAASEGTAASESGPAEVTVQTTLAGVPAILRIPKTIKKPPILLWHGLGPPGSESELMSALPLDDVPAVKAYLGLPLLGARAPPKGQESLAQRQAEDYALRIFEPIVVGAAQELPSVLAALTELNCLRANERVGLFGFSAGGTAVLVALTDPKTPVAAAVAVNAPTSLNVAIEGLERATKQPYVWSDASRKLAERTDAAKHAAEIASGHPPRALLLFHGADDAVIAPKGAVSLDEALRPYYQRPDTKPRLKLVVAPGVSHSWADPATVEQVRSAVADWFNRYL